jgi:hypothetical protein
VNWFFIPEVVFAWEVMGKGGGGGVTEAAVEMGGNVLPVHSGQWLSNEQFGWRW